MESSDHELILPLVGEENVCLPLSINAVAKYWNTDLPITEAVEIAKKYPNVNGSILIEGVELAERHGLRTLIINSSLDGLKKIIDMGIPPIVIIPGLQNIVQHASVLSGYDEKEKKIIHYIPQSEKEGTFQVGVIPEEKFDEMWSEDGRLTIVIAPPEIIDSIKIENKDTDKSNRLCFISEKQNLLKNPAEAILSLKKAIELNQKNSTAYCLLGGVVNEQNSLDCLGYYEKSIEINPKCYLAFRGLGNHYLKNKDHLKAEINYTKALEINPKRFGPIYKNRGIVRLEQNKNKEAKKDFESYLQSIPSAPDRKNIKEAIKEL